MRLKGFAVSDNGATVVYRTQNTSNSAATSHFAPSANPATQVAIQLPAARLLLMLPEETSSSSVTDCVDRGPGGHAIVRRQCLATRRGKRGDSEWSAIRDQCNLSGFRRFQKHLFFGNERRGWDRQVALLRGPDPSAIALVSAASDPAKSDDIYAYSVASDRRSRIAELAECNGGVGLFFIDRALAGRKSDQPDVEFRPIHCAGRKQHSRLAGAGVAART